MSFAVLFLHDVHGLSPARAGVVLAIFQAGAVLTRIGAGRLPDQLGNRLRPLRWIGLASAAGLLATALLAQSQLSLCYCHRCGRSRLDGVERGSR